ncbi:MAG: carbohydrate ABC transporter permease [Clostridia bacterium]|nr:carbohydrate ABC transporter permease [Clostridia bacterium]
MAVIQDVELKKRKRPMAFIYIILSIGMIVQFLPITWMFLGTFKTNKELMSSVPTLLPKNWQLENYISMFTKYNLWQNILNTVFICAAIIIVQTATSTLAAYALSKVKPKCGKFIYMFILGTQMFSTMALLFPSYIMFVELDMIGNRWSWILSSSAWGYAIVLYKGFFDGIPGEMIDAARIDGAGTTRVIFNIMFPLTKPVYAVCILNTFIAVYNDFLFPMMLLPDSKDWTLMMRVFNLQKANSGQAEMYTMLFITCIPTVLFYLFAQKNIQEGISTAGIKG